MDRTKKYLLGFEYLKIGNFSFADTPCQLKTWVSEILLNLRDARYEKIGETLYFISRDEEIVYIGEFTYTLKSRWLSKGYVVHHIYDKLAEALREGSELAMWVAVCPYVNIPDMGELNISKSLEQKMIKHLKPDWNIRNRYSADKEIWVTKHCMRLDKLQPTS
ncbi:hypothetical protein [Alteromonas lipotrueiana]|uniref:hypothetical protein n=1 Tax=Alteromonas lipotrueiana TaxID=2803815 RepID=UPI001C452AF2|nr:hypothetical protein [Alteromonas lipotrueiana]|tara:strand:+ start:1154 stop:1642 length:489 start_codon:yes stop_codon:yes gene_type:complete